MKYIFIVSILLFCLPLWAQEQDTTRTSVLDEVVVSVNRWEQNLREVSNHVTKIGTSTIQLQNPQTSADLLGLSNQVFIQKSQLGGGSPMIRGFATNRVLLVVDGVRMNNAIFRSGNVQNVISLDANSICEAEVIFGPGSVIYGSDAIGGVMDFHTLKPTLSGNGKALVSGNAFARVASANQERTVHADVNVGFQKWALTTSVTRSYFDDLVMGSNGPESYTRPDYQVREGGNDITVMNPDPDRQVATGYDQVNLLQKVRFKPNLHWDLEYGFHFSETSDVPRYDRLILKANNTFTSAEWYYGPQKWNMHTLHARYNGSTSLFDQMKVTLAYQHYEESRHNRNFTGGNRNRRTDRYETVDAISINFDFDKQLNEKSSLFYGAEYVTNEVGSTAERVDITNGQTAGVSTRYPNGSEWRSYAAYASVRHKFNNKWLTNASLRYTQVYTYATFDLTYFDFPFAEAELNNGALNGSLGVVFTPNSESKWYANLSSGFRAPNVDDVGKVFDSEPGSVVVPNPNLKPEQAYSAEMGYTGTVARQLTFDVAVFYTRLSDAIARGASTFNGQSQIDYDGTLSDVLALQNISRVNVRGLQLGARWVIRPQLQLASFLNFQKGEELDGSTNETNNPTHIAPTFGNTQLTYTYKAVTVVAYANYNGELSYNNLALSERADAHLYAKDENGNPYSPAWATANLKFGWQVTKLFRMDMGVENILDKRYRPYSSGISAPGRNFIATLRVKF
ncbi:MAG: TonB-dependent receptor plug domain-containing protein [Bacteroidota bacterium]